MADIRTRPLRCADDYGLGVFQGQPLVLVGTGECYHADDHGGRLYNWATFTEEFAKGEGMNLRPCRRCFGVRS